MSFGFTNYSPTSPTTFDPMRGVNVRAPFAYTAGAPSRVTRRIQSADPDECPCESLTSINNLPEDLYIAVTHLVSVVCAFIRQSDEE